MRGSALGMGVKTKAEGMNRQSWGAEGGQGTGTSGFWGTAAGVRSGTLRSGEQERAEIRVKEAKARSSLCQKRVRRRPRRPTLRLDLGSRAG